MKFGLGITLFYPEPDALAYLEALSTHFQNVYVFDNSPKNDGYLSKILPEFKYNFNGTNRGLSVAFNCFLKEAVKDEIDYLLILDQDSLYKITSLQGLMREIEETPIDTAVAIRACYALEIHKAKGVRPEKRIEEVEEVISSGSFINIHAVKAHNLSYDERLFVDYVDCEFCKLIRSKGLKILRYMEYITPQQLGYYYKNRVCHSAIRHYYMIRDVGYYHDKFYSRPATELKVIKRFFKDIWFCIHEDKTWKKIRYATLGYIHHLCGVTGEHKR